MDDNKEMENRRREVMRDKKWRKFLRMTKWFRHIPFVEIVFGTGSMAVGNVKEDSDFDVLIRARRGRIFTARFICKVWFRIIRAVRRPKHTRAEQKDKICLNHFFTDEVSDPGLPYDEERAVLHLYLVPLFGPKAEMEKFFEGLREVKEKRIYGEDLRHFAEEGSAVAKWGEKILGGKMGDRLERVLKIIQVKKIERGLRGVEIKPGGIARYTDKEIKFHY